MFNKNIPFYEIGRISTIKEEGNFYIEYRYDDMGKPTKYVYIKKNSKNLESLLNNYYNDLRGYLDYNKDKYNDSANNKYSEISNMKKYKTIKYIPFVLSLLPVIGVVLDMIVLINLGIVLDTMLIPSFIIMDNKSKLYDKELSKNKFYKEYSNYLEDYNINSKKKTNNTNKTIYSEVSKPKKDKVIDINLVKEKKLNTYNKAS